MGLKRKIWLYISMLRLEKNKIHFSYQGILIITQESSLLEKNNLLIVNLDFF